MAQRGESPVGVVIATDASSEIEPLEWSRVCQLFDAERWYWLGTVGDGERAHIRPVLAVWLDDRAYSSTSPTARKGRNLERRPHCSLAARAPSIDIVVEGTTSFVEDRGVLERVAQAYKDKYGWPVEVTQANAFDAPYGAPTAGHPPFRVYEILPSTVYAFGTDGGLGERSTKYLFSG
jgi:nitroimidazol reductase NimA-like FMN-containing flavoprotein (pyridoxamine 5'-phosphate oxidase superfamily)